MELTNKIPVVYSHTDSFSPIYKDNFGTTYAGVRLGSDSPQGEADSYFNKYLVIVDNYWEFYRERLLKIADHLERGELDHENFNFGVYNSNNTIELSIHETCGTNGCAIGELPAIFPDEWKHVLNDSPDYRGKHPMIYRYIDNFLGLTWNEYIIVFHPITTKNDYQRVERFNALWKSDLKKLGVGASKEEVASNIREFVRAKDTNPKKRFP